MKNLNTIAIISGLLISWELSIAGSVAVITTLVIHTGLGSKVNDHYETSAQLTFALGAISSRIAAIAVCGVASIIGGAIAGRIIPEHRLINAAVIALVNVTILLPLIPFVNNYPLWLSIFHLATASVCFVLGGWLAQFTCTIKNEVPPGFQAS